MSFSQFHSIVDLGTGSATDFSLLINFSEQLQANYRAANFDDTIRSSLPNMNNWLFTGDSSVSFGPYSLFLVEDDNDAAGGGKVNFKIIPNVNHFVRLCPAI